jgi:hypothetical protein
MNSIVDKNFYENIYLRKSWQVIQLTMETNSDTDKKFYLRKSSRVIQLDMGWNPILIKIFIKIFILEIRAK